MNGELRKARRLAELSQREVAEVLGISRAAYTMHELHQVPLPRGLTPADAIDAINQLATAQKVS